MCDCPDRCDRAKELLRKIYGSPRYPKSSQPDVYRRGFPFYQFSLSDEDSWITVVDTVAETAKTVGCQVAKAADWVKEKAGIGGPEVAGGADPGAIKPHMEVFSSCGCRVGTVDHLEGGALKLAREDSPDGQHHFLPVNWVARVDTHVHLNKNAEETRQGWKCDAASCVA